MTLVYSRMRGGMGIYPVLPPPTDAELRTALTPIKRFMTVKGTGAGLRLTL